MAFFGSGLFWLIEGILLCLAIVGFRTWMEDRSIPMPPWKWALVLIWTLMFGLTLGFVGTSLGENEINAALRGGLVFGAIVVASGVGIWKLLQRGKN